MEKDNTNQPVPPQAPLPNPSNHSKILIIITSVILLTIIGVGSYVLGTRKNQTVNQQPISTSPTVSQPSPTAAPDKTVNWKIYTNNQYGFTLQYPPTYQVFKEGITKDRETEIFEVTIMPLDKNLINAFGVGVYTEKIPNDKSLSDIETSRLDNTMPEWICDIRMNKDEQSPPISILTCRQKLEPLEPEPEEGYPRESYFISPQRYLFFIEYLYNKNNQELIDQILSTFKFTP